MAKGQSGRVVVELEPSMKRKLYSVLAIDDTTLKDWLIERIEDYLENATETKDKGR